MYVAGLFSGPWIPKVRCKCSVNQNGNIYCIKALLKVSMTCKEQTHMAYNCSEHINADLPPPIAIQNEGHVIW